MARRGSPQRGGRGGGAPPRGGAAGAAGRAAQLQPMASEVERDLLKEIFNSTPTLTILTIIFGVIFLIGLIVAIIYAGTTRAAFDWGLVITTYDWLFGVCGGGFAFVAMLRLTHADY